MAHLEGTFEIAGWDEQPHVQIDDARKLTIAKVEQKFHGDLEGAGSVVWVMAYRPDGTATFVGLQRVEGALAGKDGSFVVTTNGTFDGKVASSEWVVVDGLGTGAFAGISGSGRSDAPFGDTPTFSLDYEPG